MYCTCDPAGSSGYMKHDATLTQTLHECITGGTVVKQWDRSSPQYMDRINAVRDMIISNGYPVTFIDQPGVRNMLKVFDPKFPVLGNIAYCLHLTLFNKLESFMECVNVNNKHINNYICQPSGLNN
jgi:hypothetical protein